MEKLYTIHGMHCQTCRQGVQKTLNAVEGVANAEVNLERAEALIVSDKVIEIETLRKALPLKYTILGKLGIQVTPVTKEVSKWRQLYPLFLILSYITIAAVFINFSNGNSRSFMLDFMGLFYIVFSFFKMLDINGFSKSFAMYDPIAKAAPLYGFIYPFIETFLGILFLTKLNISWALWITIVLLGATTIGVAKTLLKKQSIQCACLGTVLKLPMTQATLIENSIMILMAITLLFL